MPTTTPFNNLITFSRGSNATVTGSNGLIQWAPANLLLQSESFDAVVWDKANVAIYPNQDIANSTFGPELVTNGAFTTDLSGWTLAGTPNPSWSAGGASMSGTSDLRQTLTTVAGAWYLLTFVVTGTFSSSFLNVGTTNGGNDLANVFIPANGSILFRATTTTSFLRFLAASQTFTLDNISAKQITFAAATAPDGTQTADTMLTNGVAAIQRVGLSGAPSSTTTGLTTYSVYVKAGTAQFVQILHGSDANAFANFNVASGTLGTRGTGASSTITDAGNGWYRCTFTFNIASGAVWYIYIVPSASAAYGALFTATVAGLLLWGAQLELGSTATTYNPTTVKNLLGFSEDYNAGVWTKTGVSIVSGAQANPINGLFNAQKLMENTTTGEHIAYNGGVNVGAGPVTASIYAKPAGRDWIVIRETLSDGTSYVNTFFNITTGTIGTVGAGRTASIVNAGNGWYRCSITTTSNAAASRFVGFETSTNGSVFSYTGDGNSGVYIYGAQLSDSASLDPYVPTPGVAPSSTAFYGPRFDFDPVTRAPRGILIEEPRTNLATYSDQFNDASWAKNNVTVTANTTTSPDGTVNADTITATNTTAAGLVRSFASTAVAYTFSVYLKQGNTTFSEIEIIDQGTVANRVRLTYATGVLTVVSGSPTGTATSVGNGWWRVTIAYTFPAIGAADTLVIYPSTTTGSIGEYCFAWGAQLELGAFATSYIPTVASTVTRSADVALISGQNFAQWYNQSAGSFVVNASSLTLLDVGYILTTSDGTNNNRFGFYRSSANIAGYITNSGVVQMEIAAGSVVANAPFKTAAAATANDGNFSLNGSIAAADTSITMPTLNKVDIANINSSGFFSGHIRSINFIPARAADFQLQALTAQSIVDYFYLQTAAGDQLVAGNDDYLYSLPILG